VIWKNRNIVLPAIILAIALGTFDAFGNEPKSESPLSSVAYWNQLGQKSNSINLPLDSVQENDAANKCAFTLVSLLLPLIDPETASLQAKNLFASKVGGGPTAELSEGEVVRRCLRLWYSQADFMTEVSFRFTRNGVIPSKSDSQFIRRKDEIKGKIREAFVHAANHFDDPPRPANKRIQTRK